MKSRTYFNVALVFYFITVISLTALCYVMIYDGLVQAQRQKSIDLYYQIYSHINDDTVVNPQDLEHLLSSHVDKDISYQMMLIFPSGHPYIHRFKRTGQQSLEFFTLPYWKTDVETFNYQLKSNQLLGHAVVGENTHLYMQAFHPPIQIDFFRFIYWLPLLIASVFIIIGLLISHRRTEDWQTLKDYIDNFSARIYEPYNPVRFNEVMNYQEFILLGNALNRINYQLHHSQRRIQILHTRLEHLVEQAPLPIILIKRNGQISFFNKRFEKIFMTSFEASVSYYLADFLMGIDKETQVALANLDSERTSRTIQVKSLEQNGTPYQLHLSPWFSKQGQVQGYCAILNDVSSFTTTLTHARNKLALQQEKLNEFDKLWSILGHELRTPLSGMLGMLELMDQDNFTEDQKETYMTLNQTSQGMLLMLNDMLDVAKMDAGKLQVLNERTDLLELSKQVIDLMASNARQQNIELIARFDPQCPRYFTTDPGRLRQALMNLLSNAIKFTQSGYVALHVCYQETTDPFIQRILRRSNNLKHSEYMSHWICFTIEDTGIGISEKGKQKLFSHFNQANESISRQFGGTGLGLAISNNFAQLLGGFIHVESEVGVGSAFHLCLPITETSYQPIYQFNADLSNLYLVAFTSQDLSTRTLFELSNHLGLAATVHTGIDKATIDSINKQISINSGMKPIILVEYELYATHNINLINALYFAEDAPKILLSMTPRNAIFDSVLRQYNAFLLKPLDVSQLVTELMRLANYSAVNRSSMSRSSQYNTSTVQQAFSEFIDSLEPSDDDNSRTQKEQISAISDNDIDQLESKEVIQSSKPLILVAEDNKVNQKVASKTLRKLGYDSLIAQNGEEALDLLSDKGKNIELILMDCRMPVVDGLEATKKIRANKNTIPIIALTANDTDSDRKECLEVGMNGFLTKPINKKSLENILEKFIKN